MGENSGEEVGAGGDYYPLHTDLEGVPMAREV